jgi:hypothetical protein
VLRPDSEVVADNGEVPVGFAIGFELVDGHGLWQVPTTHTINWHMLRAR